jgi:hypothetical protein
MRPNGSLARMGAVLSLHGSALPSGIINDLRDLRMARNALRKDQVAALTRAKDSTRPFLKRHNAAGPQRIVGHKETPLMRKSAGPSVAMLTWPSASLSNTPYQTLLASAPPRESSSSLQRRQSKKSK